MIHSAASSQAPSTDPLFRTIEETQAREECKWGRVLDAGTGGHSLRWVATLRDADQVICVSADLTSGEGRGAAETRALLNAARGDVLVEGAWCSGPRRAPAFQGQVDTILCDYLFGSMDGFTPYEQDAFLPEILPRLRPGGILHVIGLHPIYALLGDEGFAALSDAEKVVVDTARLRDAAILLAKHRPYREYPAKWIIRQMERQGLKVLFPWKSFGVIWKYATVKRQLDVARRKLPYFDDDAIRAAIEAKIDALDARAQALPKEGVVFSYDYVISARKIA